MPGKKEAGFFDEIVEGFADVVDGSIFDFDAEPDLKETDDNGRGNGADGKSVERMVREDDGSEGKRSNKRPTVPGRVEGVSITGGTKETGSPTGKQKSAEGNGGTGSADGSGSDDSKSADKSK
jgi:hypothetical protein